MTDSTLDNEVLKAIVDPRFFAAIINLLGTLIGTLIGALITYLIAIKNIKETAGIAEKQIKETARIANASYAGEDIQRQFRQMFEEKITRFNTLSATLSEHNSKNYDLALFTTQELFKVNQDMLIKVSRSYFQYQETWFFDKDTPNDKWLEIYIQLDELRQEIFTYSPFLGDNTHNLLQTVMNARFSAEAKKREINGRKTHTKDLSEYAFLAGDHLNAANKFFYDTFIKEFSTVKFSDETVNEILKNMKEIIDSEMLIQTEVVDIETKK